jgi:hypothetical protein
MTDPGTASPDPAAPILPADFGARSAVRFYLTRLAILAALTLVAVLVPAVTVLFQDGAHALGVSVVLLILLTLVVFRSALRDRGALSPVSSLAPAPRRAVLRRLVEAVVRMWQRR